VPAASARAAGQRRNRFHEMPLEEKARRMQINDVDDLPFHQAPLPFSIPWTSDVHFNDGYFITVYAPGFYLLTGFRLHPNMNVVDGFAALAHGDEQRCLRVSRALRPQSERMTIGPLTVEFTEPMRRIRFALDQADADFSFDLMLDTVGRPFLEAPYQHRRYGHLVNDLIRYTVPVRASGTLVCDGATHEVDAWHGMRDHSWGIRANMGPRTHHGGVALDTSEVDHRRFRLWVPFEVEGHSGFFHTHEDGDGQTLDCEGHLVMDDGTSVRVASVEHDIRYEPGTRNPVSGGFRLTDEKGVIRAYTFELAGTPADVQGVGYYGGWHDGQGPGVWRGVGPVVQTDRYPSRRDLAKSGPGHLASAKRLGPTEFPVVLKGPEGARGMAHFEHTVMGPYRPYGFD
jgi:hypothetical protein